MSALGRIIGYDLASSLMTRLRGEQRAEAVGIREPSQPSEALTEIYRAASRAECSPDERASIRTALGLDPLRGLNVLAPLPPDLPTTERQS